MRRVATWVVVGLLIAAGCTGEGVLNNIFGGGTGAGSRGNDNQGTVDQVADNDSLGPPGRPLPEAGEFGARARNETDRPVVVTMTFIFNDTVVHSAIRRVKPGTTTALIGPELAERCEAEARDFEGKVFPSQTFRFGIDADEDNPALYIVRDEPAGNDNEEPEPQPIPNDNVAPEPNDNMSENENANENVNENVNDNTGGGGGGGGPAITDCNRNGVDDRLDLCPAPGRGEVSEDCDNNEDDDDDGLTDCADPDCRGILPCCSLDCNTNGVPDECELEAGSATDCNENGFLDECDLAFGTSQDCQPNGTLDECDIATGCGFLPRSLGDATQLLFPLHEGYSLALGPNDDDSSTPIALGFNFDFYGTQFTSVFINNNGNLSFGVPYADFIAAGFPLLGYPMIAPFWADVDTGELEEPIGSVWYLIENNTLIVTWENVGYYNERSDKRNTFQVAISDGQNPILGEGNNVAFSYDQLEWSTGDLSDGIDGFGGIPATVGANRGDGTNFFHIGRFSRSDDQYNGPNGPPSGVKYLEDNWFGFNTATGGGNNIPPVPAGFPAGNTVSVRPNFSETLNLSLEFLSPEAEQTTTVEVFDANGAGARGLVISNSPGNIALVGLTWAPGCADAGAYTLRFTARDDFDPQGVTNVSLTILVVCACTDCDQNGVPDECDLAESSSSDCNGNGVYDPCDLLIGSSQDCNANNRPDECDIAAGSSPDCNSNGVPDECDLSSGSSPDCNNNGRPDSCDIATGSSQDCDENGVPNECEVIVGISCLANPEACEDSLFCNGLETCREDGACIRGCPPCTGETPFCDEVKDFCFAP